jgi:hypothetical protein
MAYTRNTQYRLMNNSRITSRANQLFVLVGAIIIGMIISAAVNALPSSKPVNVATKASIISTSVKN